MVHARANCRVLFKHVMPWAFCLALDRAGSSIAARMAMMAMTTSNSMSVNPVPRHRGGNPAVPVADCAWVIISEDSSLIFLGCYLRIHQHDAIKTTVCERAAG